nr:MAG TPA: hypothetical protein [Caudoviricetes sp.]
MNLVLNVAPLTPVVSLVMATAIVILVILILDLMGK